MRRLILSIIILLQAFGLSAQNVSGRVTEAGTPGNGAPVVGAGIFVKGTTRGAVSDEDGRYTIDAVQQRSRSRGAADGGCTCRSWRC